MPDDNSANLQPTATVAVDTSTTRQIETAGEVNYCRFTLTAAALGALALVVLLGALSSTAKAVACGGAQRGTLNADNTFTQGTTGSHNDYRIICTGDANSQNVTGEDLVEAADAFVSTNGRLVLQLNNAHVDLDDHPTGIVGFFRGGIVVLGTEGGATGPNNGIDIYDYDGLRANLKIESHATISTTGGADGIEIWIADDSHNRGRLQVHNFGSITTNGGGAADAGRRGSAVQAVFGGGVVEVVNEEDASVAANGPGGLGIVAGTVGSTATATNRGTITTRGNPYNNHGVPVELLHSLSGWAPRREAASLGRLTRLRAWSQRMASARLASPPTRVTEKIMEPPPSQRTRERSRPAEIWTREVMCLPGESMRGLWAVLQAPRTRTTPPSAPTGREPRVWSPTIGNPVPARRKRKTVARSRLPANPSAPAARTGCTRGRSTTPPTRRTMKGPRSRHPAVGRGPFRPQPRTGVPTRPHTHSTVGRSAPQETVSTTGDGFHNDSSRYGADGVATFSGGEASAIAVNAYEGVIETRGTGATGMLASAYRGGSAAIVRNRGRITTYGDVYRADRTGTDNDTYITALGMIAVSQTSDATAINDTAGVVETHGSVAGGVFARSNGGGTATAVNRGRVTTRGGGADDLPGALGTLFGSNGVRAYSARVNAWAENTPTGRVDTYGERAYGLSAITAGDGSRTSAMAEVVNRGVVHVRGHNADAVFAEAYGGTADNPNHVRAINAAGAAITTVGDGSTGLMAIIQIRGDDSSTNGNASSDETTDAYGAAYARNDGTIITGEVEESHGDAIADDTTTDEDEEIFPAGVSAANGVAAAFRSSDDTMIGNAGDVTVVSTGNVTVKRENATGLYAETYGSGTATVAVMGGSVRAMHETGRGLWARTGDAGEVHVTIAGGARVAASSSESIAAELGGGTTNVRLIESTLDGRALFGTGTDTFTIRDGRVTGAIDFGTGSDTLNVHGDSWLKGAVSNLETLNKRGAGNLVMRGDVNFSSGGKAVLENGGLTFAGQFNLGTTGTMRIHDAARLTAVLADSSAPPQITAGGGIAFDGDEELFLQVTPGITATGEQTYLNQLKTANGNPIANGTPVRGRTGQVALRTVRGPATVVDVGHIPLDNGATQATGTIATAGVRLAAR